MIGINNPRSYISLIDPAEPFRTGQSITVCLMDGDHLRVMLEEVALIGHVWHMLGTVKAVKVLGYSANGVDEYEDRKILIIVGINGWIRLAE